MLEKLVKNNSMKTKFVSFLALSVRVIWRKYLIMGMYFQRCPSPHDYISFIIFQRECLLYWVKTQHLSLSEVQSISTKPHGLRSMQRGYKGAWHGEHQTRWLTAVHALSSYTSKGRTSITHWPSLLVAPLHYVTEWRRRRRMLQAHQGELNSLLGRCTHCVGGSNA